MIERHHEVKVDTSVGSSFEDQQFMANIPAEADSSADGTVALPVAVIWSGLACPEGC